MRLLFVVLLVFVSVTCWTASGQNYTIATFAGGGLSANTLGTSFSLHGPQSVAVDKSGNLFFSDQGYVLRLDATTDFLTIAAGTGTSFAFNGDNGPATGAQLNNPQGVAVDSAGNLYIADSMNNRIRKVSSNGLITTVAGSGAAGFNGENGLATSAELSQPYGVAVDPAGNLYIADTGNNRIREVSTNGIITTIAGGGAVLGDNGPAISAQLREPWSIAVDSSGNVYVGDTGNLRIRKISNGTITTVAGNGTYGSAGDNGLATNAELNDPAGVAVDSAGDLYIADSQNDRIREVSNGVITTVAGTDVGVIAAGFSGDDGPATSARLNNPLGAAVDAMGNLYIADTENARIRKVSGGVIITVAGNGGTPGFGGDNGPATSAQLNAPGGVAVDSAGNLYIADTLNARIREVSNGVITTIAGTGTSGFSGDNGPATSAQLANPERVAVDSGGSVYVSDNNRIRKISAGVITTVAGGGTGGLGDNGPATSAQLNSPGGVAVDSAGNLYIADTLDNRIRKVSNGVITTVAGTGTSGFSGDNGPATSAELGDPVGVAVDSVGNLYIADNTRVRKVSNGMITTVAGDGATYFGVNGPLGDNGPATSATLGQPFGVALDFAGNLYIADAEADRIRKVSSQIITTIAGNGVAGFTGDNGPATSAELTNPQDVTVDPAGNIYIADTADNRIRILTPLTTGAPQSQTITFPEPAAVTLPAPPFTLIATASSGLPVTFGSTTPAICTVNGSTVTPVAIGTCFINASQGGNSDFLPAPNVTESFAVSANQTISFGALSNVTFGVAPFAITAMASSGLAVSFTSTTPAICIVAGATVTILASGNCSITATQSGNASYSAAIPATQSFTVGRATQFITFPPLDNVMTGVAPFTIAATASSGLPVVFTSTSASVCTITGTTVTIMGGGTCSITATQGGNANYYSAAAVIQSFAVIPTPQTITFGTMANIPLDTASFTVHATASSGLPVSFTSTSPEVCAVLKATVTVTGPGICSITATQLGNADYAPAAAITQSFTVIGRDTRPRPMPVNPRPR